MKQRTRKNAHIRDPGSPSLTSKSMKRHHRDAPHRLRASLPTRAGNIAAFCAPCSWDACQCSRPASLLQQPALATTATGWRPPLTWGTSELSRGLLCGGEGWVSAGDLMTDGGDGSSTRLVNTYTASQVSPEPSFIANSTLG